MKSVSVDSSQRFKDTSQAVEETVIRGRTTNYAALVTSTLSMKDQSNKTIDDSCWEMTYRFANEPENNNVQRKIYTGKVQIQFRNDGYSDILLSDSNAAISSGGGDNNNLSFEKVWGWDVEVVPSSTSNSDEVIDEEKKVDISIV